MPFKCHNCGTEVDTHMPGEPCVACRGTDFIETSAPVPISVPHSGATGTYTRRDAPHPEEDARHPPRTVTAGAATVMHRTSPAHPPTPAPAEVSSDTRVPHTVRVPVSPADNMSTVLLFTISGAVCGLIVRGLIYFAGFKEYLFLPNSTAGNAGWSDLLLFICFFVTVGLFLLPLILGLSKVKEGV